MNLVNTWKHGDWRLCNLHEWKMAASEMLINHYKDWRRAYSCTSMRASIGQYWHRDTETMWNETRICLKGLTWRSFIRRASRNCPVECTATLLHNGLVRSATWSKWGGQVQGHARSRRVGVSESRYWHGMKTWPSNCVYILSFLLLPFRRPEFAFGIYGTYSGRSEALDGLIKGCHWARKVMAIVWLISNFLFHMHPQAATAWEERARTPHDVTAGEGQNERAAPNGLILAFWRKEVGKKAGHHDKDKSDDYACTG